MVLIFTDLKKAQICKISYRNSPHQEFEILTRFDYLDLFRPNNNEIFLFKTADEKNNHVGEKLFSFDTNDQIVKYSSEHGFNDSKFPFVHGNENIYFMLHQKYIPLQEYENSTMKNEYLYLYKNGKELKGDIITVENEGIVEYGNDFLNCKIIHS